MLSTEFVSKLSCYTETQNCKYLKFCNDYVHESTSPGKTSTQPLWPFFLEKCFGAENADGSELILAGYNPQKN